jgi:hypothetical protein
VLCLFRTRCSSCPFDHKADFSGEHDGAGVVTKYLR